VSYPAGSAIVVECLSLWKLLFQGGWNCMDQDFKAMAP